MVWIRGAWQFGTPKTDRSQRTLTLPRPIATTLQEQHDRQTFWKRSAGHGWRHYDLVFTSAGNPLDHSNVDRRLRKLLELAGLPKMGFHGLRRSCASLPVAQGVPLRTVMEQLGHSQMRLTSDLYSHVPPAMLDEAADALDRAMKQA